MMFKKSLYVLSDEVLSEDKYRDNHDTEVKYYHVIYDKAAGSTSEMFPALNRASAVRSFKGSLSTMPKHIDLADFDLHLVACSEGNNICGIEPTIVLRGADLHPAELPDPQGSPEDSLV